jgi:pyrroline-5-carboxylate reductase
MSQLNIAFIGAGNITSSLIHGLIASGYKPNHIIATNPTEEKLFQLKKKYGIQITSDNKGAATQADVLVFAVKPLVLPGVAKEIAEELAIKNKKTLILSVVTGVTLAHLEEYLGGSYPIIRCMPNTPALVGCGVTGLFANNQVNETQKNTAESILRSVGTTCWVNQEDDINIVTALSGSGPAYFFLVMEALQAGAEQLGLSPEKARLLTLQTALGAARMALESDESPKQLRERVSPPGGTTEQAIKVLETGELRELLAKALIAAKSRAEELARLSKNH